MIKTPFAGLVSEGLPDGISNWATNHPYMLHLAQLHAWSISHLKARGDCQLKKTLAPLLHYALMAPTLL